MRIECPSCFAAYVVPDSLVTAGRVVRCARCGDDWTPVAATAAPEPEPVPESEPPPPEPTPPEPPLAPAPVTDPVADPVLATARPSAMERLAAHTAWPRPSARLRLAWAASLLVLVLAAGAAYAWRGEIVTEWPPSARVYALFGLQPQAEASQ
jgi:predicted Zn finger-like uncharacterized protein